MAIDRHITSEHLEALTDKVQNSSVILSDDIRILVEILERTTETLKEYEAKNV